MLLERKPLLTQIEQDEQEAIQYPVSIEAPVILSPRQVRKNHQVNNFVPCVSYSKRPSDYRNLPVPLPEKISTWQAGEGLRERLFEIYKKRSQKRGSLPPPKPVPDHTWLEVEPNVWYLLPQTKIVRGADGVREYHVVLG